MKKTLAEMLIGHILFIASGMTYSVHWYFVHKKPNALAKIFMVATLITGLAGSVMIILSLFPESTETGVRGYGLWPVLLACFAVFSAVLLFTSIRLKRPFTSELPLLLFWACIESCALIVAAHMEFLTLVPLIICAVFAALSAIAGLVCYSIYYLLGKDAQFIDGLIPYFTISFSMAVTAVFLVV